MESELLKRIKRTENNPHVALEQEWFQDRQFCLGFFDRCEHLAFVMAPGRDKLAFRAVHFAESHGDPHLIHRSHGVLSHAFMNCGDFYWAGKTLQAIRDSALSCCPSCRSEHLRREGDLLGEQRQALKSISTLDEALKEGGPLLDADAMARIFFLRAIAYYHTGKRGPALADTGRTFEHMSLDSPRGFFLDSAAFVAVFLRGGSLEQDRQMADDLDTFSERLKGRRGWQTVHTRSNWTRGHIEARLGNFRRAHGRFKRAWIQLLDWGLPREATACTLDRCILLCRGDEPRSDYAEAGLGLIERCLAARSDLSLEHQERLAKMQDVLRRFPEDAFKELVAFRRSFIAPVPAVMIERLELS